VKEKQTSNTTAHNQNVHATINTLVQLQELIIVRSEHEATRTKKHLLQLDESIQSLRNSLSLEVQALFQKIEKKDMLVIVPISNNVCSGCGLTLPVSLVYAVRAAERLYQCTNCARILYYPEVKPRRIPKRMSGRFEPRRPGIARFSSPSLMVPHMKASDREEVIEELAYKLEKEGFVDDGEKLYNEALKREAIINTAVDNGIAFPHVRGVEGGGLTLALGTSKSGVNFDPSGKMLSHIIFFIVIPTAASVFYLRLLAGITQSFSKKAARDQLMAAKTPEEMWQVLVKATRSTIK
jgi:mannitol/fructose-specific phosphotransferase system IIA component (Ntr-type)